MYLSRSGSRSRLRFIPSGVNEVAFELHAQFATHGSISRSRGAVVDPSSARVEGCGRSGEARGQVRLDEGPRMRTWPIWSVRRITLRRFFWGAIVIPRRRWRIAAYLRVKK